MVVGSHRGTGKWVLDKTSGYYWDRDIKCLKICICTMRLYYPEDWMFYFEDVQCCGGCSVLLEDIISAVGGCNQYYGGYSVMCFSPEHRTSSAAPTDGLPRQYWKSSRVLKSSNLLMLPPAPNLGTDDIPQGTEHPDGIGPQYWNGIP